MQNLPSWARRRAYRQWCGPDGAAASHLNPERSWHRPRTAGRRRPTTAAHDLAEPYSGNAGRPTSRQQWNGARFTRIPTAIDTGPWFNSVGVAEYIERYNAILDKLDPHVVVAELQALSGGRIPVLCCFERAGGPDWCHRALVSEWLTNTIGLSVPEFGFEDQRDHPMRPPSPAPTQRPAADPLAKYLWPTPRRRA